MNEIDQFRKIYISCPKPNGSTKRWDQIEGKLGKQASPNFRIPPSLMALLIGAFLLSAITVGVAQAAKPGDAIYQLKILTDNTISTITNNPDLKVKRRAEDVIKVSNDPKKLDNAIRHYQQTVEEVKEKTQKPQNQQKLQQTIEDQEEKFKEAAKKNPAFLNKLPEIIKKKQEIEEEVKGVKIENKSTEKDKINKEKENKGRSKK